ncbi:hypothetical protein KEM09_19825 [Carboxylicivirga mesophila]|uniref:DUF5777 domain-containing protein n=1 Tax=Carboxylicivirga mesophila TaxID=1166478 RepID=A0ABS5KGX8_9BACT|nr:DUF5777 family beta-barrel protein [Carboxylicivirga mesophila]MBS2213668.1 hypothetical protein [Carboxylicivirga mesophila]
MKNLLTLAFTIFIGLSTMAQDVVPQNTIEKDLPVSEPFLSGLLVDNQTTFIPVKKTFEFMIQHKFGNMDNGIKDVFGIYAPGAFIRTGVNYVPLKNMQVGYGLHLVRMYSDFSLKYTLLEQTRKNRIPVAVGFYGNMAIDGREKEVFGTDYAFSDRLSYFAQLIVGRKFGEVASIQANTSFSHFNATEPGMDHDKIAVGLNGRITVNYKHAILFQCDVPLELNSITEHREFTSTPYANIGLGWEIRTSAHVFQLYISSSDGFLPQHNMLFNRNDFREGEIRFGFTITRLYNFF